MYKGEFFSRVGAAALLLSGTASLRNKLVIKSKQIEPRSKYDFLKRPSNASLLNYVPYVPMHLTCPKLLRAYVPSCLKLLRAYMPTCLTLLRAYLPTCLKLLRAYVLVVPTSFTCLHASKLYMPTWKP